MMSGQQLSVLINADDLHCAALIMHVAHRTRGLPAGTLVSVRATDPAAPLDLAAWCHLGNHTYLGATEPGPAYQLRTSSGVLH